MGIAHLSYLDIPQEHRERVAEGMRLRLLSVLRGPLVGADEIESLKKKLDHLDRWVSGEAKI